VMAEAIRKGKLNSKQIFFILQAGSLKQAKGRASLYLGASDAKLDQHTNNGTRQFYDDLLARSVKRMIRQHDIIKADWKHFLRFFGLIRSNVYSGGFFNYILYDGKKDRMAVEQNTRLNLNAIKFLVDLSLLIDTDVAKPIDIVLVYEKNHKVITRVLDCRDAEGNWDLKDGYIAYAENLRKEINRDVQAVISKVKVLRSKERIVIQIPVPEESNPKK
jgi:hypothetical protein